VSSFEFFTVLLSIVVSLGVASLLHAVARLLQERPRVHFSLTWTLWAAAIFNLQITYWLRAWSYHENFSLRTVTSIPPLVLAIIAFVACALATPEIPATGPIDLRGFHMKQGRKYQIAYAAFMLVAIVQGWLMANIARNASSLVMDTIIEAGLAALAIAAAVLHRRRWVQILVPALFLLSSIAFYGRMMEA
jgi:MYXO-CTERM domain-containing protein